MMTPIKTALFFVIFQLLFICTSLAQANFDHISPAIHSHLVKAIALNTYNTEQALERAKKALRISESNHDDAGQIYSLCIMAYATFKLSDLEAAQRQVKKAQNIYMSSTSLTDNPDILYFLADGLRLIEHDDQSIEYFKKGLEIKGDSDPYYTLKTYAHLSTIYIRQEKYAQAINISEASLELAERELSQEYILLSYKNMARASKKLGDDKASLRYNEYALDIVTMQNDEEKVAQFLEYISSDQRALGQFVLSLKNAQHALGIQRELGNTTRISNLLLNISIIYLKLDRYDASLTYALELLAIDEQTQNWNRIASTNNQLGRINERLKRFDEAQDFYNRTLTLNKTDLDPKYIASALRGMASIKRKNQDYPAALHFCDQALEIYQNINNQAGIASVERTKASVYKASQDITKSIEHQKRALKIAIGLEDQWGTAVSLIQIGAICPSNTADKPRKYLIDGLEIAKTLNAKSLQLNAYQSLIKLERSQNNYKQATLYYDEAYRLIQEIDNKEIDDRIAELKLVQETNKIEQENQDLKRAKLINELGLKRKNAELDLLSTKNMNSTLQLKKEKNRRTVFLALMLIITIALGFVLMRNHYLKESQRILNDKNKEIEKKNKNLEELNINKNQLFSTISHDLRKPIAQILHLCELLINEDTSTNNQSSAERVTTIHQLAHHTFELLEDLLSWAIFQLKNAKPLPKNCLIIDICQTAIEQQSAAAELKNIHINNTISNTEFFYADNTMIATVIQNLIACAIKLTPDHGHITIFNTTNSEFITVHIKDSSTVPASSNNNDVLTLTCDWQDDSTPHKKDSCLELSLCKDLINKNGGHLTMSSSPGEGNDFYFTLPKKKNSRLYV